MEKTTKYYIVPITDEGTGRNTHTASTAIPDHAAMHTDFIALMRTVERWATIEWAVSRLGTKDIRGRIQNEPQYVYCRIDENNMVHYFGVNSVWC